MLHGAKTALRARLDEDVPILHAELYEDVVTRSRGDSRPWRPIAANSPASPFANKEPNDRFAPFVAVELENKELVGEAVLWEIDLHNRSAHIGISLRPAFRGRGFGTDIVRTLCYYGFSIRGLNRIQMETLSDNAAMLRTAVKAGFTEEGRLRQACWVDGQFLDLVTVGLLADEWLSLPRPA